jgi:hypothetical protein
VVVSVTDHGTGLTDEQVTRAFEPFYTTRVNGMGLGLPICQMIMDLHDGILSADRNGGQGMRFSFRLPALPGAAAAVDLGRTGRAVAAARRSRRTVVPTLHDRMALLSDLMLDLPERYNVARSSMPTREAGRVEGRDLCGDERITRHSSHASVMGRALRLASRARAARAAAQRHAAFPVAFFGAIRGKEGAIRPCADDFRHVLRTPAHRSCRGGDASRS